MQRALLACALLLGCAIAVFVVPSCRADSSAARRLLAELRDELKSGDGAITFPVYHRSLQNGEYKKGPGQARSTLDTSDIIMAAPAPTQTNGSNPSNNTVPPDMKSTIVTLNEPFGQFFAAFDIGTPSIDTAVIIDTGSQLLWIQCQPCIECGIQAEGYEIFTPNKSTSFSFLRCTTDTDCPGDDSVATSCDPNGLCFYHVTYGDKSNSSGYLSKDTLSVGTATLGASPSQHKDLVFGCGYINNGIESQLNASGLMGLDRGPFSLITQLEVNVFAHCLPNRIQSTKVSGYLTLGPSPLTSNITLQYTPMLQNNASAFLSQFYYMNMTGVSVNGQLLDIPSTAFEIGPGGDAGGTIIDSGTTLTSFVEEAFTIVAEAFSLAVDSSLTKADAGNSDLLCYEVPLSQSEAPRAPNVTLHFADNLNLNLDTDHLFRLYGRDTTNNYYCMAFNNAGTIDSGGKNFIGNFQQQNFLVEYDIANSRIGFSPHICDQGSSSGSISVHSIKWLFSWRTIWVIPALFGLIL